MNIKEEKNMEETRAVLPVFSKVIYINKLQLNNKKINSLVGKKFVKAGHRIPEDPKHISSFSLSKNVLDQKKFSFLKKQVMEELKFYTENVLRYKHKFRMTTSWFTKTEKNEESGFHNHRNTFISCILYLNVDDKSGTLSFIDYNVNKMFQLTPIEYNNFNSETIRVKPENNMIIFFPSEMYHKVCLHESDNPRISLACNFIPVGAISDPSSDNFVHLTIK